MSEIMESDFRQACVFQSRLVVSIDYLRIKAIKLTRSHFKTYFCLYNILKSLCSKSRNWGFEMASIDKVIVINRITGTIWEYQTKGVRWTGKFPLF